MSELHRFARHLAASAEAASRGASREPLALGEIVARLMPYRACRRALGLDSAEDYELLLLRLLAEEEGLAVGFPPEVSEQARVELASGNPDPGLARQSPDATIRLELAALAHVPAEPLPPPGQARVRDYHLVDHVGEPELPAAASMGTFRQAEPSEFRAASPMPGPDPGPAADSAPTQPVEEAPPRTDVEAPAADEAGHHAEPLEPEPTTILADRLELEWASEEDAETAVEEPGHAWEPLDEPPPAPLPLATDAKAEPVAPSVLAPRGEEPGAFGSSGSAAEELPVAPSDTGVASGEAGESQEPSRFESPSPITRPTAPVASSEAGTPRGQPSSSCPHCGQVLPVGRPVRFCPSCGCNVAPLRCLRCLSELEPEWRHCVSCGHPVADSSRFA